MLKAVIEIKQKIQKELVQLSIVVNDVRDEVEDYKKKNVFMRYFHRAFKDDQILDKVCAVNYLEISNILEGLEETLPSKMTDAKALCFTDPQNDSSEFPQYNMLKLYTLPKEFTGKIKGVDDYFASTQKNVMSKVDVTRNYCDVWFYKGKSDPTLLQSLTSALEKAFQPVTTAIKKFSDDLIERIRRITQTRAMDPPKVQATQEKVKQLGIVNTDMPHQVDIASKKAGEIRKVIDDLSPDEVDEFLKKYPDYQDPVTLNVMCNPVLWQANKITYEREPLLKHIKNQLKSSTNGKIKDYHNTEFDTVHEKSRTLVLNSDLQNKILDDLKLFQENLLLKASRSSDSESESLSIGLSLSR